VAQCHRIDTSKNKFHKYRFVKGKVAIMKIVWRNPNPIYRTSFSIVKTLAVEHPDELRVFYRSSRGQGALGSIFELLVNRDGGSRAA
jgi:hypothetical protein